MMKRTRAAPFAVADTVQLKVETRAVQALTLNDPRLTGVDTLTIRTDAAAVKDICVIGTTFSPHRRSAGRRRPCRRLHPAVS